MSFPGRNGDLIWGLPAIRALSRRLGHPVDLQIAGEFALLGPLLRRQPYLGEVLADARWGMHPPEEWRAPDLGRGHDYVFDLGYRGWPTRPLPFETLARLNDFIGHAKGPSIGGFLDDDLDLNTPWITVDGPRVRREIAVGFTEAWFELKLGVLLCVQKQLEAHLLQLTPPGSRWTTEVPDGTVAVSAGDWVHHARTIQESRLFFGDCSALHVLAVAIGTPVLLMEPMEARHNRIFYPCGWDGPQVTIVKGNDGRPTHDARHCKSAIEEALATTKETFHDQEARPT